MESQTSETNVGVRGHILNRSPAFVATLIGGAVAMGVNAPLTSPDDLIANAGSIAVVSVIGAIVVGMIWARLPGDIQTRSRTFNIVLTVLLLLVVGGAAAIEYGGEITRAIRYTVPLAAIVTIFTSVLTPVFERSKGRSAMLWVAIALPLVMLVAGYLLTINEFGFTEAPSLSLPPPPKSS
ncbi:MAG: hypothetical protein OXC83_03935 [Chloroflexi bacterium]|nr:hypothetical protein [Chloroflexota bacterium]